MSQQVKKVSVQEIKELVAQGYTRKMIAEHYGVKQNAVNTLFKDSRLAGIRAKKTASLLLVEEVQVPSVQEVREESSCTTESTLEENPDSTEQEEPQTESEQNLERAEPEFENL
jgi:hypothetical protein